MKNINHPSNWKYASNEEEGFFEIVTPENSACKITWIYRLNLASNSEYILQNDKLELNGVVIKGAVKISNNTNNYTLKSLIRFIYLQRKN